MTTDPQTTDGQIVTTPQAPQEAPQTPQGTPTPRDVQQAASEAHSDTQGGEAESVDALPAWAQREIRSLRTESAQQRTARATAEQDAQAAADERIQAILKAAGIDTGASDEDPVKAAATARAAAEEEAKAARLELAVYRAATTAGADPAALLDSRAFLTRAHDLDPTDTAALTSAIRDAVQENPRLGTVQAATRSSADFTGGNGDGATSKYKPGMSIADGLAADGAR
ncbi:hypothetical protein GCM10009592_14590 [Brachybacterium rhamnosum]|uniref:Scaffolding protein n=1 Tax=Brachybacterium rhamnosum TaxID=173361 RepID=A0ABW4PXJ8_9MICO